MYIIEINKLHVSKKLKKEKYIKKQIMIRLSDQNMATNPQIRNVIKIGKITLDVVLPYSVIRIKSYSHVIKNNKTMQKQNDEQKSKF